MWIYVNKTHVTVSFLHILYQKINFNRQINFSDNSCVWTKIYANVLYLESFGDIWEHLGEVFGKFVCNQVYAQI